MERPRQDPEQLLRAISREEATEKKGHLNIFFGYAAGVGKTYAMLEAAHAAQKRGIDVVAGYVEPHARPETAALLNGLKQLPTRTVQHGDITLQEFDLDAAMARMPRLILVDELAHTNAEGSRHDKRYQDINELLKAGVDVYTTVNVQHIESLNDTVASITGVMVRERIPDSVFDNADQVELVDIEPEELIERLSSGQVYRETQAQKAVTNFFTLENLTALREIALRRCADRVNLLTENARIKNRHDYHTDEHILVCLSAAPSNAKIIRTAARMANAFRGAFTALFVETPDYAASPAEDKKRLQANIRLAQQLGATIETVHGDDVPLQIAEFARISGVSKIVIGRSTATRRRFLGKPSLTEKLIAHAPNLDIYIIPDNSVNAPYRRIKAQRQKAHILSLPDVAKSLGILLFATLIGFLFAHLGFTDANIITVYILGVLVTSIFTSHRVYSLLVSVISVLLFNFFFTAPHLTFLAYDKGYPVTFIIMLAAALITGSLATRLKKHAKQTAQAAFRTKVLFDTNQILHKAKGREEIITATAKQIIKLLGLDVVTYLTEKDQLTEPQVFTADASRETKQYITENEKAVAAWVLKNNKHAGATTNTLTKSKCLYLAIRVNDNVYGVVGIAIQEQALDTFETSILLSILGECALALENDKNAREKEEAAILAKHEQLRANLLRAISHDLRTPLTSISGNASNLLSNSGNFSEAIKQQIYKDIYEDALWLINLVENLLAVTRIEEGKMNLSLATELMDEVITEALRHVNRSGEHQITVDHKDEFILAKIDAKLIVQVIINIVDNAIKYTPPGSQINIAVEKQGAYVVVKIADNGPGLSAEAKDRVFDMFYSGANKIADSRRSLGLGLSLCKSIIKAHGGEISVADNVPQGTVFTFTLPAGEVKLHE